MQEKASNLLQSKENRDCENLVPGIFMITEMVIAITNADIESHTAIEFLQIPFYIRTVLDYEIYYIQITVPCSCIIAVIKTQ